MDTSKGNNLEAYIKTLEKKEKASGKKKWLWGGLALLLAAGGGGGAYVLTDGFGSRSKTPPTAPMPTFTTFRYHEASLEAVASSFTDDNSGIIILDTNDIADTFYTLKDYLGKYRNVSPSEMTTPASPEDLLSALQESATEAAPYTIQPYNLSSIGERADEPIVFSIRGYDANVKYLINFGDGTQKIYAGALDHSYAAAGTYDVIVTAVAPDASTKTLNYRLTVKAGEARPLAGNQAEPDTDEFIAKGNAPAPSATSASTNDDELRRIVEQRAASRPLPPETPNNGNNTATSATKKAESRLPSYPGGDAAIIEYLNRSLRYPQNAVSRKVQGRVVVQFEIGEDGKVRNARVLRGIGSGCDEEALRVVNNMPAWQPALENGTPVSFTNTIPINFRLDN